MGGNPKMKAGTPRDRAVDRKASAWLASGALTTTAPDSPTSAACKPGIAAVAAALCICAVGGAVARSVVAP